MTPGDIKDAMSEAAISPDDLTDLRRAWPSLKHALVLLERTCAELQAERDEAREALSETRQHLSDCRAAWADLRMLLREACEALLDGHDWDTCPPWCARVDVAKRIAAALEGRDG